MLLIIYLLVPLHLQLHLKRAITREVLAMELPCYQHFTMMQIQVKSRRLESSSNLNVNQFHVNINNIKNPIKRLNHLSQGIQNTNRIFLLDLMNLASLVKIMPQRFIKIRKLLYHKIIQIPITHHKNIMEVIHIK